MPLLDMDAILEAVSPPTLSIKFEGKVYRVRRLATVEAMKWGSHSTDEEFRQFLLTLFVGEAPPVLQSPWIAEYERDQNEILLRVKIILRAIELLYLQEESLEKKLESARTMIRAQICPTTSSGPGSSTTSVRSPDAVGSTHGESPGTSPPTSSPPK